MSLFIGLSALQSSQTGLDVISQNIANANTPGYHRQNVHLQSLNDNLFRGQRIGSGVSINDLERVRFSAIESFLTDAISDFRQSEQRLSIETRVETVFLPGEGSLQNVLESLFNDISSLAGAPSDQTTRQQVVQSGIQLASQFRALSRDLQAIQDSIHAQITQEVATLNIEIEELSNLNQEITAATSGGNLPNGLLDIRDELINSIAQKIDVSRIESADGSLSLTFGNYSIQRSITDVSFSLSNQTENQISLSFDDGDRALQLSGGRLASLIDAYNELIPSYSGKLDELASSLIRNFDQVHATGIGVDGSFSRLVGNRAVTSLNAPLIDAGVPFPIEAGSVFISITDPNGNRRTETIGIDPETQSLNDVVGQINSLSNLNASVNPQTNRIQISASPGYKFDFTGSLETVPSLVNFAGSSEPSFSGKYSGTANSRLNFEIIGSGNVGVSGNLSLRVTDESGNPVTTINIGNGYEAGTPVLISEGVEIHFAAGGVLDGDTFSTDVVATPDETGFLSSLGINSFFVGNDSLSIDVDQEIIDDPRRFSSSLTGDTAEATKIGEFTELSDIRVLSSGRLSFSEYLIEVTTEIGVTVRGSQRLNTNLESLLNQYQSERDSISGVDVNEEFVRLTQFQRSYEAAVRVIQTADAILDELFTIIR